MKKLSLILSILLVTPISAYAERTLSLTIPAAMPSPESRVSTMTYGSLTRTIGDTCTAAETNKVTLEPTSKQCIMCNGSNYLPCIGSWTEIGVNMYPTNAVSIGLGGVTTPAALLHMSEGNILSTGTLGSSPAITTAGAGTRLIWYPRKASLRAGGVVGTDWDDANIGNYTVAFGFNNQATADYSGIFSGRNNTIADGNPTFEDAVFIGGGIDHSVGADSRYSVIAGGKNNDIGSNAQLNTISGGSDHVIPNLISAATISGGISHVAGGSFDVIGGGSTNYVNSGAVGTPSTISGGFQNHTRGPLNSPPVAPVPIYGGFIGGGQNNELNSNYSAISGGANNIHNSDNSTIGGGTANVTTGTFLKGHTTIAGGRENAAGDYASVGGGFNNNASGEYSTVGGGGGDSAAKGNVASGLNSTVPGGEGNVAGGDHSWAGGKNMQLTAAADDTFIWGVSDSVVSVATPNAFIIYNAELGLGVTNPTNRFHINDVMRLQPQNVGDHVCSNSGEIMVTDDGSGLALCLCDVENLGDWVMIGGSGSCI